MIPMGVLVSTLVTIGVMTKNSELLVMRACGVSLYRTAAAADLRGAGGRRAVPHAGAVAGYRQSPKTADRLERVIRHWPPVTNALSRRWVVGRDHGSITSISSMLRASRFSNLAIYRIDQDNWSLQSITQSASVTAISNEPASTVNAWVGTNRWTRGDDDRAAAE